jgi:hypothetical protein
LNSHSVVPKFSNARACGRFHGARSSMFVWSRDAINGLTTKCTFGGVRSIGAG